MRHVKPTDLKPGNIVTIRISDYDTSGNVFTRSRQVKVKHVVDRKAVTSGPVRVVVTYPEMVNGKVRTVRETATLDMSKTYTVVK